MLKLVSTRRVWLAQGAALALGAGAYLARGAEAAWPDERSAGVFRLHADFQLDAYEGLIAELETLQEDLERELHVRPPREEIHLFLFGRKGTYQAYLEQYFPRVPVRRALFIKGRGPGMVFAYRSGELAVDVRHECTHALVHASVGELPLWLDEGLAEYYEVAPSERAAGSPYASSVRWNVRFGYIPDLEKLERLRELHEMGRDEYRDAWAWAHFLMHGSDASRDALRGYLRQVEEGPQPGALSAHLRRHLGDPEREFAHHFRRWDVRS